MTKKAIATVKDLTSTRQIATSPDVRCNNVHYLDLQYILVPGDRESTTTAISGFSRLDNTNRMDFQEQSAAGGPIYLLSWAPWCVEGSFSPPSLP